MTDEKDKVIAYLKSRVEQLVKENLELLTKLIAACNKEK